MDTVRPWIRFWARYIDITLFAIIIGFFSGLFYPFNLIVPAVPAAMIILFVWLFVETTLLSTLGTTPGKWLLGIELKNTNKKKPNFHQALKRSFWVWLKGLGVGLPFINIFALGFSYYQLRKTKITVWDRDGHFIVSYKKIGIIKVVLVIMFYTGFAFLILY